MLRHMASPFSWTMCGLVMVATLMLSSCSSCSHKSEKEKIKEIEELSIKQPEMTLSSQDTNEVMNLTRMFLEQLKAKNIDNALSMLYYLDKDKKVVRVPQDLAKKQREALSYFPVYGYKIEEIKFFRETDSEISYSLIIQDPKTTKEPASITGLIRPMRVNGKWYLTLADSKTDTFRSELDKK